jgi:iron complex outermembrane recepter protein
VQDTLRLPVDGATLSLYNLQKKLVKTAVSDKQGRAEFARIPAGEYEIVASFTGYASLRQTLKHEGGAQDTEILLQLKQISKELKGVTVEARKPFIERRLDRLIVNVENSIIGAGASAFEVLEKSPGVVIDQNDNISLKGKAGVMVMIDGKLSPMSGSDLATMLRGLPSNAVERIEIMSNPSAKYDATGNAGIINIVMKKDKRLGTNGTLTAGIGQGIYHRRNAGISFNHRNAKLNIFGNYNYAARTFLNDLTIDRDILANGQKAEHFFLFNHMLYPNSSNTLRLGADYFVNKKTTIGVLFNGFINNQEKKVDNSSTVTAFSPSSVSRFSTNSITPEKLKHYSVNLNLKHVFDSLGQELTIDLDNALYDRNSTPQFTTTYFNNGTQSQPPYILNGSLKSGLKIWSAKADYTKPIGKKMKLEAGVKTSFVNADNDLQFFDMSTSTPKFDADRSNHFIYDENINAFYATLSREAGKWSVKAGLRGEQANIYGVQRANNQRIDTSYLQLFPSAFFTYKLHPKHELGLSYSRRIRRPTYSQLNPFQSFIDLTSFNTGNPYLRPQFTDNYEMSYTLAQRTTFTFSYARDYDVITWIILPKSTPSGTVSVETYENISTAHYFGLNISNQMPITKWWNTMTNVDIFKMNFNGVIASTPARNTGIIVQGNTTQSFTLPKRWTAELTLNYQGPEQTPFAFSKAQWMLSAGAQKAILKGKGSLRFNVADIFRTFYPRVTSEFVSYRQYFTAARDTRIASVNFTYRFGKNTVSGARRRTTGVEDEKSRAQ